MPTLASIPSGPAGALAGAARGVLRTAARGLTGWLFIEAG